MSDVFCKACKDQDMCAHLGKCWVSREELDIPKTDVFLNATMSESAARIEELEGQVRDLSLQALANETQYCENFERANAAEARVKELEGALRKSKNAIGRISEFELIPALFRSAFAAICGEIDAALASGKPHTSKQEGEGEGDE